MDIQTKRGHSVPQIDDLLDYQFGLNVTNSDVYIRNGNAVVPVGGKTYTDAVSGLLTFAKKTSSYVIGDIVWTPDISGNLTSFVKTAVRIPDGNVVEYTIPVEVSDKLRIHYDSPTTALPFGKLHFSASGITEDITEIRDAISGIVVPKLYVFDTIDKLNEATEEFKYGDRAIVKVADGGHSWSYVYGKVEGIDKWSPQFIIEKDLTDFASGDEYIIVEDDNSELTIRLSDNTKTKLDNAVSGLSFAAPSGLVLNFYDPLKNITVSLNNLVIDEGTWDN
jgi:hypothetical protein